MDGPLDESTSLALPVRKHQVLGKEAYDAKLVAAMRVHQIKRILTYNEQDFRRYEDLQILHPDQVLAAKS